MFLRLIIASTAAFLITVLGHLCIYDRLVFPLSGDYSKITMSLVIFLWSLTFFGFPLARIVPGFFRRYVELPMFIWMGSAYIFLLLCVITIPIHLFVRFLDLAQYETYLAMTLVGLGFFLILGAMRNANSIEDIVETQVSIPKKLSKEIESLKIVLLSDIHVSGLIGGSRMSRLTQRVNSLNPDLVFVLGDLVDGSVRQLRKHVLPLKGINTRLGVYYVTGNHEYYCGADRWKRFVREELNWNVLSNSCAEISLSSRGETKKSSQDPNPEQLIQNLLLVGLEDRSWLHQQKKKEDNRIHLATQNVSTHQGSGSLSILLAHQPKDAYNLNSKPWIDLQVSGHTHGGQLWPLKVFVYRDQTYNVGLYRVNERQQIYVSQGTGFWGPPMRLGTRCEISLLRFKGTV